MLYRLKNFVDLSLVMVAIVLKDKIKIYITRISFIQKILAIKKVVLHKNGQYHFAFFKISFLQGLHSLYQLGIVTFGVELFEPRV